VGVSASSAPAEALHTEAVPMRRDPGRMQDRAYDLLVIGGGIHGVWIAWDAALRGLSVALVERNDFGSATSANTMRIAHGGLRYLQHCDLRRMRESVREQRTLMRLAPQLVRPLACLLPTRGHGRHSRWALALALRATRLICSGADRGQDGPALPPGRILTPAECVELCPWLDRTDLTGGALWHDAQLANPDRLLLSVLRSAVARGVDAANYVEVTGFLTHRDRVLGVRARDRFSDQPLEIRARLVVNAAGPWADRALALLEERQPARLMHLSKAINLVVPRVLQDIAVGVVCDTPRSASGTSVSKSPRVYFITPWNRVSLIGTAHLPLGDDRDACQAREREIRQLLGDIQQACPALGLRREDVLRSHAGALPAVKQRGAESRVRLVRRHRIHDHGPRDGLDGLISVVGVKYTTARAVAEEAVDLAFQKLGHVPPPAQTAVTPIQGQLATVDELVEREMARRTAEIDAPALEHLFRNYGASALNVLGYVRREPGLAESVEPGSPILRAETVYVVQEEMARRLSDVVLRRTTMGACGPPGVGALNVTANLMARELGWDEERRRTELEELRAAFQPALDGDPSERAREHQPR
jgi:glycerol-3-phosphate dehydrogenase